MTYLHVLMTNPRVKFLMNFFSYFGHKVRQDNLHVESGYLAYVTIMSLVPLMVVMFSIITAFPIFTEFSLTLENFIYNNFVPTAGDIVKDYLKGFVANASKMSAVAITFLFLFALLLISSIDKTLNKLWKVTKKRSIITSFSMYWMILTLGPILIGSSVAATSYIVSLVSLDDYDVLGVSNIFLRLLPWMTSIACFFLLYTVVPNKKVSLKYALFGAIFAAVLFEIAKKGFAIYITQLPSYQAIYGALATIPILFLWVYLSWVVVLLGAQCTVSLEEFENKGATT